jgi:hypothetical protein
MALPRKIIGTPITFESDSEMFANIAAAQDIVVHGPIAAPSIPQGVYFYWTAGVQTAALATQNIQFSTNATSKTPWPNPHATSLTQPSPTVSNPTGTAIHVQGQGHYKLNATALFGDSTAHATPQYVGLAIYIDSTLETVTYFSNSGLGSAVPFGGQTTYDWLNGDNLDHVIVVVVTSSTASATLSITGATLYLNF